jgi:rhombotail lipoprotein
MSTRALTKIVIIFTTFHLLIACATTQQRSTSSSAVEFLYPEQYQPIESPQIPQLSLPLRLGVAFVPSNHEGEFSRFTEKDKFTLMKEVSENFKKYPFIKSIELIPSNYLRTKGSFSNLEQLRQMFNIDVIALLGYDQAQFTDRGWASITYWTLVGAYIVQGEKNDTHTIIDANIYHIPSRKMLFRAPGVSHIKSRATPVNLSEQQREDMLNGFKEAGADLVVNLQEQLKLFQERLKESPDEFKVVHKPGYTGGGEIDTIFLLLALLMSVYGVTHFKE